MPTLPNYHHFEGESPDTGTIRNALAYQHTLMPHSDKPITEALLFGISGGVAAGYFTFEFHGYDPTFPFMTRYTFDPTTIIFEQLGIQPEIRQTDNADKGLKNLTDALEAGKPVIVWADMYTLAYNRPVVKTKDDYGMMPLLVYGYDDSAVHIADRAHVPLTAAPDELAAARGRVKKEKYRVMTLGAPDLSKLPAAVKAGIETTIKSMSGIAPIKPLQGKFGPDGFTRWAELLVDKTAKGWGKLYPGVKLYTMLMTGYEYMLLNGNGGDGSRSFYADFLIEAAHILNKPALNDVAQAYRQAAAAWVELGKAMLPDSIPAYQETRDLIIRDYELFLTKGNAALPERHDILTRQQAIRDAQESDPMPVAEQAALRESVRDAALNVRTAEVQAVDALRAAMN